MDGIVEDPHAQPCARALQLSVPVPPSSDIADTPVWGNGTSWRHFAIARTKSSDS